MKNTILTEKNISCTILVFIIFNLVAQVESDDEDIKFQNMMIRLNNSRSDRTPREGRVEVSFDFGVSWGTICSTRWSLREANVVCRELKLGFAAAANMSQEFGSSKQSPWALVGTLCRGNEQKLSKCFRESQYPTICHASNKDVAIVRCVPQSPDLSLGLREIEKTARLDAMPLHRLTCAMEENCLSRDAYVIRAKQPNATRLLLRFATKAENVGNADFSPYANLEQWQWHQCHRHYHSMENFASFDIYNLKYEKVSQGHKASFCLMDTICARGIRPVHYCSNFTQGISVGCADIYTADLDCQWVDVTNLPRNKHYILRVALNSEYKIGEISFENNGAECILYYTGERATTKVTRCTQAPLWFKI